MCLIKLQWPHGTKKYTTLHIEVHAFWMVRNLGLSEVKRRAKEKIQKIAPRCTKPNSKPQMAIYHDVYHDVSTEYLQCILCTPKWFEVHQNILKTQAAQAWGTDQKDQTHWTRIHAYGILWLQMMLALLRLCESFNIAGMPKVGRSDLGMRQRRPVGCTRWILLWGCDSMCCLSWCW